METEARAAERAPLAWVRVLGRGALRLDFGHAVAVGALGRVLVAGRFDATAERANEAADAGELVQLDASGAARWRLRIVRADQHCAPSVAMDDAGGAYVLGAFAPVEAPGGAVLVGMIQLAITKLGADGRFEPGVGVDASGAAVVWGCFSGGARFDEQRITSATWARFLVRLGRDGAVKWAQVLRAGGTDDYSVAVLRDGGVMLAAVVRPHEPGAREPGARDLLLAQLDTEGSAIRRTRFRGAAHACAKGLIVASAGDGVALAGYFSGAFTIAGHEVRSATPASEALFVAHVGAAGGSWARAIQGPQLQAGLSVHGDASGAVMIAGWCAGGTMDFRGESIEAGERAAFFAARFARASAGTS